MSTLSRAVRITQAGGPEVLSLGEIQVRDPGAQEVLVQIAASGLNRADALQRKGVYPAPAGTVPDVPGLEFSGKVAKIGADVRGFKLGDEVMGICAGGAMATHLVMHERELVRVPRGVSLVDAAAIPEVFMTAYDAMFLQAGLVMGERVLIHAVASGVGTAALQLALAVGALPIGTSRSQEKLERVKELGLEHGIVPNEQGFAEQLKGATQGALADVILDTVGAKYLAENVKAAANGGRIVTIGLLGGVKAELPLGLVVAKRVSLRGSVLRSRPLEEKAALAQAFARSVVPLFERGLLKPVIAEVMPMTEIREAHRRLEADEVIGKLVLSW
ncbi:MAG: NAD(P)H-quinone oxidoreductase [Myxococcales bacterium]